MKYYSHLAVIVAITGLLHPLNAQQVNDVILQEGNSMPQFRLLTKLSSQLVADTRMGTGASFSQNDLPGWESILGELLDLGAKHVTTSLPEGEPPISWDWPEDQFPWEYDQFINGLNDNGVVVNYVIHFWDKAGHARGEELSTPRFKTADQVDDFLDYVRLIVSHYKGRAQYYTIWSEPDACGGDNIKCIEPNDYINLVRKTVPVIHEEDSLAKVSIAPNVLYFAHEYLFTVLESNIMPMVDMIQWHGIYDVFPNSEYYGNYYYEYPTLIEEIKQTASAHGFDGEYWGTEITWTSEEFPAGHASDQPWEQLKTDKEVAKYYSRAIPMHLGMDVGVEHMGFANPDSPWRYPTTQNLYTLMAGTTPTSLTVNIESEATNIMSYGFTLPDGDRLFALWTDGEAVDDDPGVSTTLTFPGLSAQKVVGIDVLNGFEQQLITSDEDSNLVIRGLLVKDYAIIVRFSSEIETSVQSDVIEIPTKYSLYQNFPNPFNPTAAIRFDLPQAAQVNLVVYDILGREVARLVDGYMELGNQMAQWDGRDRGGRSLPSGIYIARLVTPEFTKSIKMLLLK